ncbi:DUF7556 family protein [Haloarchaeobius baliensis]
MSDSTELVSLREEVDGAVWVIVADPDRPNAWLGMTQTTTASLPNWR